MKWFQAFLCVSWIFFSLVLVGGLGFYLGDGARWYFVQDMIARGGLPIIMGGEKDQPQRVVLLFAGDVMLGRFVETLMRTNGSSYPFEHIGAFLARPHLTHVNLEGPIVFDHQQTQNGSTSFSFSEDKADVIVANGIDVVSLGNNHTLDRGSVGYEDTTEILKSRSVLFAGHATAMGEEYQLATTVEGEPLRFLSFNVTFPFNDEAAAVETVRTIAESTTDMIIVNVHWGTEYQLSSNSVQQDLAHQMIDAGADLIIGHHPHVVQEIEEYEGKLIFYSLGNFVFDQYFSQDVQEGLAVSVVIEGNELRFRLHPLESIVSQPRLMNQERVAVWLADLAERSDPTLRQGIRSGLMEIAR